MQALNQNVAQRVQDIQRDLDSKPNQDPAAASAQVLNEVDAMKQEINDVLTNKINENHQLIEESARRMDALIKEANQLWTFFQKFIDEHSVDRE